MDLWKGWEGSRKLGSQCNISAEKGRDDTYQQVEESGMWRTQDLGSSKEQWRANKKEHIQNGHDTKVLHTTSQGRASFGDRDPEMSQALRRTHSQYTRLVLEEIPQQCLQFSSVHPVRNEAAWGINYSGNSWINGLLCIGLDSFTWFPFIILISSNKRRCTLEGKWICEVPILRCLQQ